MAGPWEQFQNSSDPPAGGASAGPWSQFAPKPSGASSQGAALAKKPTGFFDSAVQGFKRSLPETKSLAYGAVAAGAGAIGADGVRDWGLKNYQRVQREEVEPLAQGPSFTDAVSGDGSISQWAGDTLGNFGGQALQSLAVGAAGAAAGGAAGAPAGGVGAAPGAVVGGIGGLVARGAARRLITKEAEKLIADQVAKGAVRETAEAAGNALVRRRLAQVGGGALASTGLNVGQEVGIAYTGRADEAQQAGQDLTRGDAVRAIGWGVPAGLVDQAAEGVALGRILAGRPQATLARRLTGGAAAGALTEGGTEAVQGVMERAGAGQALTGDEAYTDYLENFAAGALGGGVLGAGSGSHRSERQALLARRPQPQPQVQPQVQALPAPDGSAGYGTITVNPDGTAATAQQRGEDPRVVGAAAAPAANPGFSTEPRVSGDSLNQQGGLAAGQAPLAPRPRPRATPFPNAAPGTMSDIANAVAAGRAAMPGHEVNLHLAGQKAKAQVEANQSARGGARAGDAANNLSPPPAPWIDQATGEVTREPTNDDIKTVVHNVIGALTTVGADRSPPAVRKFLRDQYQLSSPIVNPALKEAFQERAAGLTRSPEPAQQSEGAPATDLEQVTRDRVRQASEERRAHLDAATPASTTSTTIEESPENETARTAEIPEANGAPAEAAPTSLPEAAAADGPDGDRPGTLVQGEATEQRGAGDARARGGDGEGSAAAAAPAPDAGSDVLGGTAERGGEGLGGRPAAGDRQGAGEGEAGVASDGGDAPGVAAQLPASQDAKPEPATSNAAAEVATSTPAPQVEPAPAAAAASEPAATANAAAPAGEREAAQQRPSLDEAAHRAATSPMNDRAEPTEAQKEAGNYAKGHHRIAGLDISIENPAGSRRRPEWPELKHHYGYIKGTIGRDKDHVDVFLTPDAEDASRPVFVVDQVDHDGKFDEHKVVMGAATEAEARQAYLDNYSKGWTGLGGIKQMTQDEFKEWVKDPKKTSRRVTRAPRAVAPAVPATTEAGRPIAATPKTRSVAGRIEYAVEDPATLRAYFTPGQVVPGYAGSFQRVEAFKPSAEKGGRWSVRTIETDKDGNPVPDARVREHFTAPTPRDLRQVLGDPRQYSKAKKQAAASTKKAGQSSERSSEQRAAAEQAEREPAPSLARPSPEATVQVIGAERATEAPEELWRAADQFYRQHLQGQTIDGPDGPVRFSSVGRTKALSTGRRDPLRMGVARHLADLAKVARIYEHVASRDSENEQFAYAAAPVEVDGTVYAVRMLYRSTPQMQGERGMYTFEGYEVEGPGGSPSPMVEPGAGDRGRNAEASLALQGSPGSGVSVADLVAAFKQGNRAFSRPGTGTARGLDYATAAKLKRELTSHWGEDAPAVVLVDDAAELPARIREMEGADQAEGAYDGKGTVYLNLSNIGTPERFGQVLAHEAVGHYGVERIVGQQQWAEITAAIDRLASTGGGSERMRDVLRDVRERYPGVDRETFAKEAIAVMAERGIRNSLINRVIAAVRRFLRQLLPGRAWSEQEITDLLARSDSFLRAGTPQAERRQVVQQLMFSRPEDIRMDGRGERFVQRGQDRFLERGDQWYLAGKDGQPADFLTLSEAQAAAERAGGQVLADPNEGARRTWSVVLPNGPGVSRQAVRALFSNPTSTTEDIEAVQRGVEAGSVLEAAKRRLADLVPAKLKDASRPTWLGALATRHLTELGSDYFQQMGMYSDYLTEMQADRNQLQAEADTIAEDARKWAGKNREQAQRLFGLMHDATIDGVDPSKAYQQLQFRSAGELLPATAANVKKAIAVKREQIRGRAGDSKKDLMADIEALKAMGHAEKRRERSYAGLVDRWNSLPPEAQAIYKQFRDSYQARSDAMEQALVQRIEDMKGDGVGDDQRRLLVNRIRQQFEEARLQGVYFPLQRYGKYFVAGEKGGDNTFLMFERHSDVERAVTDLRNRGWTITAQGLKGEQQAKKAPPGSFIADVIDTLRKNGVSEKTQDDIYQVYLQALPELSMRKHSIHRKNVPGFDPDAVRAFAYNMQHGSHQLARLRYSHKLEGVLDLLNKQQDAKRKEPEADTKKILAGDAVLDELRRRHQWIMNPTDSKLTNLVSSFGFTMYLGATPAAALVNLSQTPLVTYPYLAARFGAAKAGNYLLAASRDAIRTNGNIQRVLLSDEERRAHAALLAAGAIDKSQAHNLAGIAEGGMAGYNPKWARAMEIIGWGFHKTEVINREATAIAAFRLARGAGQAFDEAVRFARDAVFDTHFDYSNANRARYMQSGTAKVLLMFRQYGLNMAWALGRMVWNASKGAEPEVRKIARRNLAGVLGMSALFSGALGLPTSGVVLGVLNSIAATFGDDDEPWDAETEFAAFLRDMLGDAGADVVLHGPVNKLTGADIAGRVGMSSLFFQDVDKELVGTDGYHALLEAAAGPVGGTLKNVMVGAQHIQEGRIYRGVETMLPKSIKDVLKAGRYATQGVQSVRGDPIIEDVSPYQVLLQGTGFTPDRVSRQYEANHRLKDYETAIMDRRASLVNAYAMSARTGDSEGMAGALERIQAFNLANPEVAINNASIRSSLRARARYSERAEAGIVLNPKLAARLEAMTGADAE